MSTLLLDTSPLVIIPELACAVGLNESIVLQQIHYWVAANRKEKRNFRDGHFWTYSTYAAWQKQFPFWSVRTIKSIFTALENNGLVISGNYNKTQMDRTKWYRIDYNRLKEVSPLCNSCTMESARVAPCIEETITENTTIRKKERKGCSDEHPERVFSVLPNVFRQTLDEHGKKDTEWALEVIGAYVDELYPAATGRIHEKLNKAQRMGFAKKFLDFVNPYSLLGDVPYDILKSIATDGKIPDPTIFIATSPKVLGHHAVKLNAIDYYEIRDDIYCPYEDYV